MQGVTTAFGRATIFRTFLFPASACALLALAGCGQPGETDDQPKGRQAKTAQVVAAAKAERPRFMLDGRGLIVSNREGTRSIPFGSPAAGVIAAAAEIYGSPKTVETLEECGAGALQVSRFSGLTLAAQEGKFAGWWLDGTHEKPLPTAASEIGIGSTREALEAAYAIEAFDSSLGDEFTADGLAGLTEGAGKLAKITHLWAGATCIMR